MPSKDTSEDVIDAVHAAMRRALVKARVRKAIEAAGQTALKLGVPSELFDPVAKLVEIRYFFRRLEDFGRTLDEISLENTAERFIELAEHAGWSKITVEQLLEAHTVQQELVTNDAEVNELVSEIDDKILTHITQLFGTGAEAADFAHVKSSIQHFESALSDLRQMFESRFAALETERHFMNAIDNLTSTEPGLDVRIQHLPVRIFVDGSIMAEARIARAVQHIIQSAGFEVST